MNLPNKLTLARIFLIPIFLFIISFKIPYGEFLAAAVFIMAASTDGLDGYFARKNNMITRFGKIMDPIADKLLIAAALISLVGLQKLPAWVAVVIIGREFAVSGLRTMAAAEGYVISASKLGKYKTISQIVAIAAMFLSGNIIWPYVGKFLMAAAVFFTVISGVDYYAKNWHIVKKDGI